MNFDEQRKETSKSRIPPMRIPSGYPLPSKMNFIELCYEVAKRMKARHGWSDNETLTKTGFYIE